MKKLKNYKPSFNSSLWIGLALVFLYLPLLVMAIFSFNDSKSLSNWSGFSLRWYQELFANQQMIDAIIVSVSIAILSTVISTILGTITAIGVSKSKPILRKILLQVNNIPIMNPEIVTGISLMLLFSFMKIEKGYITGSRIVAAPRFLCAAGSHGDLSQGFARNPELSNIVQNLRLSLGAGKDFFVNAVREEIKYGADFIKIMATGGFFTPYDNPSQQQMNDEELKAIMDTAHEWGKTVTAHVYSVDHMQKLIKFGIDGMEHCSLMDEETAQMIIDNDVYVVPTFCPYEEAVHYDPVMIQTKQEEYRIKLEYYKDALQEGREVIKNCKCKLGYGTDMVATHQNYESGYEFKAWMESGMGTFRTLHAATKVNSEILQLEDKIGTLEPGKYADIAAWKRDLMTDPYALLDCAFVMKEGVIYPTEKCEELTD